MGRASTRQSFTIRGYFRAFSLSASGALDHPYGVYNTGVRVRSLCVALGTAVLVGGCGHSATVEKVPWTIIESSPTSSTVLLQYYHGVCDSLTRPFVAPTSQSIHITLRVIQSGVACAGALKVSYVRVRLGGSLGQRTLTGFCRPAANRSCYRTTRYPVRKNVPVIGPAAR